MKRNFLSILILHAQVLFKNDGKEGERGQKFFPKDVNIFNLAPSTECSNESQMLHLSLGIKPFHFCQLFLSSSNSQAKENCAKAFQLYEFYLLRVTTIPLQLNCFSLVKERKITTFLKNKSNNNNKKPYCKMPQSVAFLQVNLLLRRRKVGEP